MVIALTSVQGSKGVSLGIGIDLASRLSFVLYLDSLGTSLVLVLVLVIVHTYLYQSWPHGIGRDCNPGIDTSIILGFSLSQTISPEQIPKAQPCYVDFKNKPFIYKFFDLASIL